MRVVDTLGRWFQAMSHFALFLSQLCRYSDATVLQSKPTDVICRAAFLYSVPM